MSDKAKQQHNNILLAIAGFAAVVVIVALIGFLALDRDPDIIQGEMEVGEYRVSGKVPGRILELRVREGDFVRAGDTLAIIEAPEVDAKMAQAQSAVEAASAVEQMAKNGARKEMVQAAFQLLEQAKAGLVIAEKTFNRMKVLFEEEVVSAQKFDEAEAMYKSAQAQVKAAQSQYDMAVNGARAEEKRAAQAQVERARGAVEEVNAYMNETVLIAQKDGEVSSIYPMVGELMGTGSPVMTIAVKDDLWGTFNVREDQLSGMQVGTEFSAYVPAFKKNIKMKVYYMKDQGSYATWKATKATGQYDLKTFEVRARPTETMEGLLPGMSLVIK